MQCHFSLSIVYSFDGILVFGLLFICTCAYLKKVPRLNNWLLSEKKGVWGVFYKGKYDVVWFRHNDFPLFFFYMLNISSLLLSFLSCTLVHILFKLNNENTQGWLIINRSQILVPLSQNSSSSYYNDHSVCMHVLLVAHWNIVIHIC